MYFETISINLHYHQKMKDLMITTKNVETTLVSYIEQSAQNRYVSWKLLGRKGSTCT